MVIFKQVMSHFSVYTHFFPKLLSIFSNDVTQNVAAVHTIIHIKNIRYPMVSCSHPAIIPGSIIPNAINAVHIA